MAATRPLVRIFNASGSQKGETTLPAVFSAPIRQDVVQFVHTNMAKNSRQPFAVSKEAGHQTSAESWGTGRAVSRIPRVGGGGTSRSGQGAFGNMCRGGRMFAPTKTWRRWHRKINVNQRRYAMASALAATAVPALVMARGHRINKVPEIPLVVSDINGLTKTKDAYHALKCVGASGDVDKAKHSKKLRAGKGKMRNRRFTMRRGPLVIYKDNNGLDRAFRNLPGVELCHVDRLNLLQLAPGGHLGRFCVWTADAFKRLDQLYGTYQNKSELKHNYALPRAVMANADLARLINSDEVQQVVRPARSQRLFQPRKHNPLRNRRFMDKLNPYHRVIRQAEAAANAKRAAHKKSTDKQRRLASRAFYNAMRADEYQPVGASQ